MLLQNSNIDHKTTSNKAKIAKYNQFLAKSPYLQYKTDKTKYKEYLPRLSTKTKCRINDNQLTQISFTKPSTSQPQKLCKTQVSEQINHMSTMYSHKHKIQFSKTKKIHSYKIWHQANSSQNQPQSLKNTNKITFNDNNQRPAKHKSNTKLNTYYQQRSIQKLQQRQNVSNSHHFQTQTFHQNIIRNRLKIRSSLQVQQPNSINGTQNLKNKQRYRTQVHQVNDSTQEVGPSRLETQTDFRFHKFSKTNIQKKQGTCINMKNKNKKLKLYVPSFTRHKITPTVIQNLLKKIQLDSSIKNYQTQTFHQQTLFHIPQANQKLQKEIKKIHLYFKNNKKQWFSHQLQKMLKNQPKNLNQTQILSKSKERSRSEKIGKIVKQSINPAFQKKKQTQSLYSDDRFEEIKESQSEGKTVVLHDNSYRKQIVQIEQSSIDQNKTQINPENQKRIQRIPSDEFIVNAEDQKCIDQKKPGQKNSSSKIHFNERPKSTESINQRNSNNRTKRKSQKGDQCIIF